MTFLFAEDSEHYPDSNGKTAELLFEEYNRGDYKSFVQDKRKW